MKIAKEWLDFLREQYPAGSRIQLREIGSDPAPIPPGSMGTLDYIDDAGQFQISWDKGRSLALVIGADRFTVLPPEPALLKLYMPLTADFYPRDEWGDSSEEGERWDDRTLTEYEDQILGALVKNRMPEERERGLMHWYGEQDSLNAKVSSAEFTVEVRDGCLWGVAECQVVGELTSGELTRLKDFISGQASDGWGEGFEHAGDQKWMVESCMSISGIQMTGASRPNQEQFVPQIAKGLRSCASPLCRPLASSSAIRRGESGYYPSEWETGDKERNVEEADRVNERWGSPRQRVARGSVPWRAGMSRALIPRTMKFSEKSR